MTIQLITNALKRQYGVAFTGRIISNGHDNTIAIRPTDTHTQMPDGLIQLVADRFCSGDRVGITWHEQRSIVLSRGTWERLLDYLEAVECTEVATEATVSPFTQNEVIASAIEPLNTQSQTPPAEAEVEAEDNDAWVCTDCEATKAYDENPHILNGNLICERCFDHYRECANCDTWIDIDNDSGYVSTEVSTYCENCSYECTFFCNACEETFDGDDYYSHNDNTYCSYCYNDRFFSCDDCGESCSNSESYGCDDCGSNYCEGCWDSHDHNLDNMTPEQREERERTRAVAQERAIAESAMRNPWRSVSNEFYKGKPEAETRYIKVDRFMGIEIEAEKGDTYGLGLEVPKEVGISLDGSLHDRGVELQTPPASLDKLEEFVNKTCEALQKKGYKGTKSAGLHVHIDARDIRDNHEKITQVIKTFYAIEDMLYSMLPPSRWASNFCQRLSQGYLLQNFREKTNVKDLQKEWYKDPNDNNLARHIEHKYDSARYFGLNIHSVFYRGTIELRYHSGTVNPMKILQWANLTLRIMDWALKEYDEALIQKLFDMETGSEKYKLFKNMLNLPYDLEEYITSRMNKFNPSFMVKFNKGKKVRAVERRQLNVKKKKVEEIRLKCENNRYTELKNYWLREGSTGFRAEPSDEELRQEARDYSLGNHRLNLPQELQMLMPDGGFIEDREIRTIQNFMQQGRRLHEDNQNGEGVDIEE